MSFFVSEFWDVAVSHPMFLNLKIRRCCQSIKQSDTKGLVEHESSFNITLRLHMMKTAIMVVKAWCWDISSVNIQSRELFFNILSKYLIAITFASLFSTSLKETYDCDYGVTFVGMHKQIYGPISVEYDTGHWWLQKTTYDTYEPLLIIRNISQ